MAHRLRGSLYTGLRVRIGKPCLTEPGRARRVPWRAMRSGGVGVTSVTVASTPSRAIAPLLGGANSRPAPSKHPSSAPGREDGLITGD